VNHEVDFQNFMIILWNMCTLDVQQLARVLFRYFKENPGPTITPEEVDKMVDKMIGQKKENAVCICVCVGCVYLCVYCVAMCTCV
jgi:hypothetical protein